ncbi:hypothetical protein VO178_21740 [Lysinibacillus fusiformis]|uniref:hypothetical protein n=1 Tax=Lysinibacillus fusiformis TaxID=28031 RepID=UPI002D79003F|nr:hypothetical protein [Lysinibacillus fusiformis]WRS97932.1 hypothetical protein VO178_21740 [Lysinibacillus fusiformis]
MVKRTRKHSAFAVDEAFDIDIKRVESRRDSLTVLQALKTVYRQMEISGNRPRTIESYEFAWNEFIKVTGVKYVEDIDADMIYDYLHEIDVSNATKLVCLKSLKAIGAQIDGFYCSTYIRAVGDANRITIVLQTVFSDLIYRRLLNAELLATFR